MNIVFDPNFVELFPTCTLGFLAGRIDGPKGDPAARIAALRQEALTALEGLETATLTQHPHIAAWRQAYSAFGTRAKKHKPTHEALARRLLRDEGWPEIHPLVDLYLTNQVAHMLPHGGYDTTMLEGDLHLGLSPGGEPFEPLGGGQEEIQPGEVVYRDARSVLTRRWNYRDAERTKIRPDTRTFLMVIESPSEEIPAATVKAAVEDLARRYAEVWEGEFIPRVIQPSGEAPASGLWIPST